MAISFNRRGILRGLAALSAGSRMSPVRAAGGDDASAFDALFAQIKQLPQAGGQLEVDTSQFEGASLGKTLLFSGLRDFKLHFRGGPLFFDARVPPIRFNDCSNVGLVGLSLNCRNPPFFSGSISEVSADAKTAVISLDAPLSQPPHQVLALTSYNKDNKTYDPNGIDLYGNMSIVKATKDSVVLAFKSGARLTVGETVIARTQIYEAPVIFAHNCESVRYEGIEILCGGGMGFVFETCADVSLTDCRIHVPTGSNRLMSLTADGAHFSVCRGTLQMLKCSFADMGDDAVNVNNKYNRIVNVMDDRRVVVSNRFVDQLPLDGRSAANSKFNFVSADNHAFLGTADVAETAESPNGLTLSFSQSLPKELKTGDYLLDQEGEATTKIVNCEFRNNRARGVLLHSDAEIRGCVFHGQSHEALLISAGKGSIEGPDVRNVTVVGNQIDAGNRTDARAAMFVGGKVSDQDEGATFPPDQNVTVTGNRFTRRQGLLLDAQGVKDLRLVDNTFTSQGPSAVTLSSCTAVVVRGNHASDASTITASDCTFVEAKRDAQGRVLLR